MSQITDTFDRLQATFDSGHTRSFEWRDGQLAALAKLFEEERDAILGAVAADVGKPIFEAFATEFPVGEIISTRAHLQKWMETESVAVPPEQGNISVEVVHDPLGIALIIGAWNYPVQLTLGPLIAAIAGGNVAVIKPSELVPNTAQVIQNAVEKHLDPKAFAVIQGGIPETTELLSLHWDKIFFTGSPAVGKVVLRAAAENLVPAVLELGGKSPAIVCEDANLDSAATRVTWGKFFNAGQTCVGVDYALVHESRYEEFIDKVADKVTEFFGEDPAKSADLARIVNVPNLNRLVGLLDGQKIVCGGDFSEDERYLAPTVVRDVALDSPIMQEEIFGPILPIRPYSNLDDAIEVVNDGERPLAAYFFTEDEQTQQRLLTEIRSGGACINDVLLQAGQTEAPFGGVGHSGMGEYHGYDGYLAFTHRRTVFEQSTESEPAVRHPPYPSF